jgi:hypothetical protein
LNNRGSDSQNAGFAEDGITPQKTSRIDNAFLIQLLGFLSPQAAAEVLRALADQAEKGLEDQPEGGTIEPR